MKPLKLTMTAFGPYKDTEVIDFTQLHEHGIFVVSGSTGAGKTTIFDAITYALYDTGSGEDREKANFLRSDFADEKVDTEVELIFEVRGRTYRIWRKFGPNGAGSKREFYDITGGMNEPVVEKFQVRPVQAKVEELIGLTQSQFNQIVMLPQGEFQKLLTSESKHKEEIFRKIFKTERFTKMVDLLKDKRTHAQSQFAQAEMKQNQYILDVKSKLPNRESQLFSVIDAATVNMYQLENALDEEATYYNEQAIESRQQYEAVNEQLKEANKRFGEQKMLNERIEKFQQRQVQLNQLQLQATHFEQQQQRYELANRASNIEPLEFEYKKVYEQEQRQIEVVLTAQKNVQQSGEAFVQAQTVFDAEKEKDTEREQLVKTISKLEQLVPIYNDAATMQANIQQLELNVEKAKGLFNNLTLEMQKKKEEQATQRSNIDELESKVAAYENVFLQHQQLQRNIELVEETLELQNNVRIYTAAANEQQENALKAQAEFTQLESQMRSNQAAFLAANLQHGHACPVCGSTEHPSLHTQSASSVDEKTVAQLRAVADEEMKHYYAAKSKLDAETANFEKKHLQLESNALTMTELPAYKATLAQQQQQLTILKQQQQQLIANKASLKQVIEEIEKLQVRIENGRTFLSKNETELAQEQGKLAQSKQAMLPQYQTVEDVNYALQSEKTRLTLLQKAFETATIQLQQAEVNQEKCKVSLMNVGTRLKELQNEIVETKERFNKALQTEGFITPEAYSQAKLRVEERQAIVKALEEYKQQLHTLTVQINEDMPQLEGKELVDLNELEQQLQQVNRQVEDVLSALKNNENYEKQCRSTLTSLLQVAQEIEESKAKLSKVEHVYDLVRGQNEHKISFERFAQIGYLEKVTQAANERLRILSDGQYYLQCTGRKEGNAQSGLSIDVFDSNTGQTRDVKTLSGGEKFNASLSLALGMADVIQGVQGSVHIDTMFIDEGFGTLDEESLRKAIDILIDLQQTGRLIGVISHVAELKAAMPAILHVEKLKEGYSRTSIVIK
ncbi:SMC family ATPase [Solibacillus sp. FSL H8-0538]|uniref:SMC family ATPase n=1 Tax=Solibacillus sp. FSL H8-0538 TaxID=2921400 RepID=UPI0030FB01CC